jgi:hypothetical protein
MAPKDSAQRHETPRSEKRKEDKLLDKSLEDTFPASDPSSVTRAPKEKRETTHPPSEGAHRQPPPTRHKAESESDKNR